MNKKPTTVEYEEAPSGHVTFYNYKEPLMKFTNPDGEGGHGFVGALLFDGISGKVQCHLCGKWFEALSSNHLQREHSMTAKEYKKVTGLMKSSALISEKYRASLIANGLERRVKNLKNQKGVKRSAAVRRKIRETLRENRDEMKNLRGTCPEQLIERLVEQYRKLGRTPTRRELSCEEALIATYGSMQRACQLAGIPYRKPGETNVVSKFTEDYLINFTRDFFDKNGKLPTYVSGGKKHQGYTAGMHNSLKKFGRTNIQKKALNMDGRYRKCTKRFAYTNEELLDFLRNFEKVNGRKPSYSDSKRGLLPNLSRYSYNFGSWKKALSLAFPA